mmetsp:Transcript_28417/g.59223  ORF Transcript_28417/g.59223 Transcript_28417/m.59223 type:complete len:556 (+) Transcript_28417:675-2342(+)
MIHLTKNFIVYGAPGADKSCIGQYSVLYAISQALSILSRTLMGVQATALGGIHLHKLFKLPTNVGPSISLFCVAQLAMQGIRRDKTLLHALLTLDVLFLDKAGQTSTVQLSAINIILHKLRNSQIPFGGVLFLGTMDPSQLKPINQLPFLTLLMMLTSFRIFKLKHSVRAHGDPDFERLQAITRMNPYALLSSNTLKTEFFQLACTLTYVPDWNDRKIGPNMMRAFSRKRPAVEALRDYRQSIMRQLNKDREVYVIAASWNTQRLRGANGDWAPASDHTVRSLNKELKEPEELVFFVGGVYGCTINDTRENQYCQSQLAFLLELPPKADVTQFQSIPIWIAPPGNQQIQFDRHQLPTQEELVKAGWSEVSMGTALARIVPARYSIQARRKQYLLKHIGTITINKAQGTTLSLGIAIKITKEYSSWESGQIVVSLSQSTTLGMTIIVGERSFAIKKMWELITMFNQWTHYTHHMLDLISVNRVGNAQAQQVFDYPEVYPFRLQDSTIPKNSTGYAYCLISKRYMVRIYIRKTENLSQRIVRHNAGTGATGTADPRY